jgi:hypothetical protein
MVCSKAVGNGEVFDVVLARVFGGKQVDPARQTGFNVSAAASALDVSRTWLFTRMDSCDRIRKASDLVEAEIRRCQDECRGDLDVMVARLEVSKHGLKQRMTHLRIRR